MLWIAALAQVRLLRFSRRDLPSCGLLGLRVGFPAWQLVPDSAWSTSTSGAGDAARFDPTTGSPPVTPKSRLDPLDGRWNWSTGRSLHPSCGLPRTFHRTCLHRQAGDDCSRRGLRCTIGSGSFINLPLEIGPGGSPKRGRAALPSEGYSALWHDAMARLAICRSRLEASTARP